MLLCGYSSRGVEASHLVPPPTEAVDVGEAEMAVMRGWQRTKAGSRRISSIAMAVRHAHKVAVILGAHILRDHILRDHKWNTVTTWLV